MGNALRISSGRLSRPDIFSLASFLRLLSKTSLVKFLDKVAFLGPLASRMRLCGPCYGYFVTTQWHVEWWLVGSSYMGACLWKEVCCECHISWTMS